MKKVLAKNGLNDTIRKMLIAIKYALISRMFKNVEKIFFFVCEVDSFHV